MKILPELKNRTTTPTLPFFEKVKKARLIYAALGTAILTGLGIVLVTISQLTVHESADEFK